MENVNDAIYYHLSYTAINLWAINNILFRVSDKFEFLMQNCNDIIMIRRKYV